MHSAVARNDRVAVRWYGSPAEIAAAPPGLLHQELARRDVPGMQLLLPVALESTTRDVAQVQSGAAVSAHGARGLHEGCPAGEVVVVAAVHVVREARGKETAAPLWTCATSRVVDSRAT